MLNAKEAKKIANELADVTAERVAYVMSSDKPKVVEEAVVPKYPSSPNTKKNTAMGGTCICVCGSYCYCTSLSA